MRSTASFDAWVFGTLLAFFLTALVFMAGSGAFAANAAPEQPSCSCPDAQAKSTRPKYADFSDRLLDESDEAAALESLQVALSRMSDGAAYIWRRDNGRLSGLVRPTASFRSNTGSLCRHVVVLLTTGFKTRSAEGIACRLANRRWQLEG